MGLTKKTTILFPPDLHERLKEVARKNGISLGELVRRACTEKYGIPTREERLEAVRRLAGLSLPVGTPDQMECESVPDPDESTP